RLAQYSILHSSREPPPPEPLEELVSRRSVQVPLISLSLYFASRPVSRGKRSLPSAGGQGLKSGTASSNPKLNTRPLQLFAYKRQGVPSGPISVNFIPIVLS